MVHRCKTKKVFGKTFHKNMSASDLKSAWDKVPDILKSQFTEVDDLIKVAVTAETSAKTAMKTYQTAKKVLETNKKIVLSAAATEAGNPSYAPTVGVEEAAKAAIDEAVKKMKDSASAVSLAIKRKMDSLGLCQDIEAK